MPRILRPRPGGRRATAPPEDPAPQAHSERSQTQTSSILRGAGPGLITLAMPLLQLMARLRTMATQPDPARLRERAESEMRNFEARVQKAGVPADVAMRAHYTLCASLDDLVLNTPWGARGAWADQRLVDLFHAAVGRDRFFDVLRQAQDKGPAFRPLLELMYICLSLGVTGRYRDAGGTAAVEPVRAQVAAMLANDAPPPPPALSPNWQGVAAPFATRRNTVPVWVGASIGLAALAWLFLVLSIRLNDRSDALFSQMLAAAPAHMPQVTRQPLSAEPLTAPALPEPSPQDRLRRRLAGSSLTVVGTAARPVVLVPERGLFAEQTATLLPGATAVLRGIAMALRQEAGALTVIGYTDTLPVHTVLFPSSFQLTAARAQAAAELLGSALADPARIRSEGRGSAEPVASNATVEGREQNRRIEIMLDSAEP